MPGFWSLRGEEDAVQAKPGLGPLLNLDYYNKIDLQPRTDSTRLASGSNGMEW